MVLTPDVTIDEWDIPNLESTVYEENPSYDKKEKVVVLCWIDTIMGDIRDRIIDLYPTEKQKLFNKARELNLTLYAFPESRLEKIDPHSHIQIHNQGFTLCLVQN